MTRIRNILLSAGLLAALLMASFPTASAHPLHCDQQARGDVKLWVGSYIDQLDLSDPDSIQSGIVQQGFHCCWWEGWSYQCATYSPLTGALPDIDLVES